MKQKEEGLVKGEGWEGVASRGELGGLQHSRSLVSGNQPVCDISTALFILLGSFAPKGICFFALDTSMGEESFLAWDERGGMSSRVKFGGDPAPRDIKQPGSQACGTCEGLCCHQRYYTSTSQDQAWNLELLLSTHRTLFLYHRDIPCVFAVCSVLSTWEVL